MKPALAYVVAQPARFVQVFIAGKLGVLQALDEVIEFVALKHFLIHGEELRARFFRQLDKILPAFGIVSRVPHDAVYVFRDVSLETAQPMPQNEGVHVVFEAGQIVWHGNLSHRGKIGSSEKHHTPMRVPFHDETAGRPLARLRIPSSAPEFLC